ncbi:MbtH family protein [Streptomyces sp. NPDC048361]|uniref:MbtH family protein n=1 Tax=Streptomyces sp. NPDC048361 TaxID=3154720 RepID=UPI00344A9A47
MPNPFETKTGTYLVLTNEEGQHSLWPNSIAAPAGWPVTRGDGTRQACPDHIERTWKDMRPNSLRRCGLRVRPSAGRGRAGVSHVH